MHIERDERGRFVEGHVGWYKGKKLPEWYGKKISKALMGHPVSEETKRKIAEGNRGKKHSEEWKKKRSKEMLGNQHAKGHEGWCAGKHIQTNTGRTHFKKGQVPWNKGKRGVQTAWNKGKSTSEETRRKWFIANHIKPNRKERFLIKLFNEHGLPFYYVGDGKLIIDGKCPDFSDGNGNLIELFGDYWHQNDDPQERIDFFKKRWYNTLIIWEHELKKPTAVVEKIRNFKDRTIDYSWG